MSWMESEVKKYYADANPCGLSSKEFCESILTLLRSEKGNDLLQNEACICCTQFTFVYPYIFARIV